MTHNTTAYEKYYSEISDKYRGLGLKNSPIREKSISPVLIDGEFMAVAFVNISNTHFYINVGKANAYSNTCYGPDAGTVVIDGCGEWYKVEKEEGNQLYKDIISSRRTSKKGYTYYRLDSKRLVD